MIINHKSQLTDCTQEKNRNGRGSPKKTMSANIYTITKTIYTVNRMNEHIFSVILQLTVLCSKLFMIMTNLGSQNNKKYAMMLLKYRPMDPLAFEALTNKHNRLKIIILLSNQNYHDDIMIFHKEF